MDAATTGAGAAEVESGRGCFVSGLLNTHTRHGYAVLHRCYGSRRLPVEKFLVHVVPVFVAEH